MASATAPSRPAHVRIRHVLVTVVLATALAAALALVPVAPAAGEVGGRSVAREGLPQADDRLAPVTRQGGDGVEAWTRTAGLLETTTGPDEDVPVSIDHDLYVPAGASAADPRPAMVVAHGFGNTKSVAEVTTLAAFFASRGYVVITSTHQGFGASSGCVALDAVDWDSRNVSRLIDLLAARDDVATDAPGDPVVGMVGGSYGGGHQPGLAAIDPRLDAMSPGRTWHALQYSLVPNNLVGPGDPHDLAWYEQGVFKAVWTTLFFALGSSQPAMGNGGCDPLTQQTLYPGQPPCSGFDPVVCPIYAGLLATGDATQAQREAVARSGMTSFTEDVDIPVLLTQGQSDTLFTLAEATAGFERLRAAGNTDVQMLWNDGGHGYPPQPGEGEPYSGAYGDTDEAQESFRATTFAHRLGAFFDHHLRGIGDPGPTMSYFRSWVDYDVPLGTGDREVGSADAAYAHRGAVPALGEGTAWTLTDDGLVAGVQPDGAVEASLLRPAGGTPAAHSETPNFTGPGQPGASIPPSEVEGQHVALDTPPFTAPAELVGIPTLDVVVETASGRDAVVFTKLYDVAPDGSATLLRRLVAASRVPAELLGQPVTLRLPGLVHRFEAGHRVRLVVATTDDSYRNDPVPDVVTLSGGAPAGGTAVLHLPLEGGDQVARLAGPDRIATALTVSGRAFPTAEVAVLVRADDFADALTAGPLAAALDAPLLLTGRDALDERVRAELARLRVDRVVLVGGEAALTPAVAAAVAATGAQVDRVAGADRVATSLAVARALAGAVGGVDGAVLARPDAFADALAAGSLATQQRWPIVLVDEHRVSTVEASLDVLIGAAGVVVAGGESAVSAATVAALDREVTRVAGPDRHATAVALAGAALAAGADPEPLLLASAATFPDALAAVSAASALGGMVLPIPADPEVALAAVGPLLQDLAAQVDTAFLIGGPAALPDTLTPPLSNAISAG